MNIYQLEPVKERLDSHHWQASSFKGPVKVQAASEDEARDLASIRFGVAVKKMKGQPTILNPWSKAIGLVNCHKIGEDESTEERILEPKGYE